MKTKNTNSPKIIAALVAGTVALTAFTPAVFAHSSNDTDDRGYRNNEQHRDGRHAQRRGGGFIPLVCSENGAERLENALTHIPERIELTTAQQTLFDDMQTAALTAQTQFADSCVQPIRGARGSDDDAQPDFNPADGMAIRLTNMQAMVVAMEDVVPTVEAFFDSLTDEQKADLRPNRDRDGDRNGHGPRHGFGPSPRG